MDRKILGGGWVAIWLGAVLAGPTVAANAGGDGQDWQERRLFSPSSGERRLEAEGQIYIYDGLAYGTVDRAMDQHFDRIENMMFTRIHHPPLSGSGPAYLEDDGCD